MIVSLVVFAFAPRTHRHELAVRRPPSRPHGQHFALLQLRARIPVSPPSTSHPAIVSHRVHALESTPSTSTSSFPSSATKRIEAMRVLPSPPPDVRAAHLVRGGRFRE